MLPLERSQIPALFKSAQADHAAGRLAQAQGKYRQIKAVAPQLAEVPYQLARIADDLGELEDAKSFLADALAIKPSEPVLLRAMLSVQARLGNTVGALALHDRLIALAPKTIKPRADKASYLQEIGDFSGAAKLFRKLLKENPYSGEVYRVFLGTQKLKKGDPLIRSMLTAWKHPKLNDSSRKHLGFALAKAMEDSGQTDKVFGFLRQANGLQRAEFSYDPSLRRAEVAAVLKAQEIDSYASASSEVSPTPVFVTGMPRSGTTLVEQIIASHSQVTAGGELGHGLRLAYQHFGTPPKMKPLAELQEPELETFAQDYALRVQRSVGRADGIVTDKSIQTHLIVGLLHRAIPNARFVFVQRDPRDIALSIYKNYFADGTHRYSNDLADIARYIKGYQTCVRFWKERLGDVVHEVHYEDLVAAPEEQSRALIAAAGLDWEDGCLDFHKAGGSVRTLSLHQVRQPIYRTQAKAWTRYESELAPFEAAWKEAGWD